MSLRLVPRIGTATAVALAAALLLPLLGGWQVRRTRDALLADVEQNVRTLSHSLAQQAARAIETVDIVLSDVAERVEHPDGQDLRGYLDRRTSELRQTRSIVIYDAAGALVEDATPSAKRINVADREYFTFHQHNRDSLLHIGAVVISKVSGLPVIPLSRRIANANGSFAGIVVAPLLPDYFTAFYKGLNTDKRDAYALWDDKGSLLVRYPAIQDNLTQLRPFKLPDNVFTEQTSVSHAVSLVDGVERIIAYEHLDKYPLVVSAAISVDDALAEWRQEATTQCLVLVMGSLALLLLAYGLERYRRSAKDELGEKSSHLQATLDNMNQGLIKVSAAGVIQLANRRLSEIFEIDHQPLNNGSVTLVEMKQILQDRGNITKKIGGTISSNLAECMPFVTEDYELARGDGWAVEVHTVPMPGGGIIRTYSDISERRRAEDAMRDSEARYRMLADTTSDVITQLDLNFRRRYVSPACRVVLGFEPEEMIGIRPSTTIHPDEAPAVRHTAEQLVAGTIPEDRTRMTYRMRHKSGAWVWVEASISLVREDATGKPQSLICSLRDVTERQLIARHLEQAKTAAENAARQKSEFVANMSHELRTPLTGILGLHDLLGADPTLGPQQRRYLIMARDAGRALLTVINDVLDFSKIEAGELAVEQMPFDLLSLVEACEDLVVEAARAKGLRLSIHSPDSDLVLLGDEGRIKQIVLNLLTNAVKFTELGSVTLTASYNAAASLLHFEISDTGIGIPGDKLAQVFKRFSQADTSITRRFGGTGLGLAICKRLTELMGGRIGVTSEPGAGSTFWFEIPAPRAAEQASGPEPQSGGLIAPQRVLLAEDNLVNQEVIKAMLATRGHEVTIVDNGAAAAAAAAVEQGGTPNYDLIFMDLQMPIMDGLTATRVIRAAEQKDGRAPIPIIGLTANAMVEDVERCLGVGMNAHVAKPIDWAELFTTMEDLVCAKMRRSVPAAPAHAR